MKRSVMFAALFALLCLLLCGCGGDAQQSAQPAAEGSPPSPAEMEAPAETEAPATVNEELTALVTEDFTYNFDEADWYPYIDSLTVYDSPAEGRWLEIIFRLDEPIAQRCVRTVVDSAYGNYAYAKDWREHGIEKVIGVDNRSGKVWYTRDHLG